MNGVKLKIKFSQTENAFSLTGSHNTTYKVEIVDSVLKICQFKLKPQVFIAHNEILSKTPALYPIWQSDVKTFNIQPGNYERGVKNVYHGCIPNSMVLAPCSSQAYSGSYTKTLSTFITTI